jgi:serpin B
MGVAVAMAVLITTGCQGSGDPAAVQEPDQVRSEKQRITVPSAPKEDMDALVAGNTGFAFDLYHELVEGGEDGEGQDGNLFYSPFSISQALAMTYAGARENTKAEMAEVMRFTLPDEQLHPAWNDLDLALASRGENAQASDGQGFRLNVVNSTWGMVGYPFLATFLDILAQHYGAGMYLLDFMADPAGCTDTINTWVEDKTEGRIEDLIPLGTISKATRMVLVNAIYFNAAWLYPFDEENTADGYFHLAGGGNVTAPLMVQEETFGHAAGTGWQAVELPYDGEELSMVVILPDEGLFHDVEAGLDEVSLGAMLAALTPTRVELTLPKFTFTSDFLLNDPLKALGMVDAFTFGLADFSGMDGSQNLYIGAVIHKAFVDVNEAGTEAAAATAVIMDFGTSIPPDPIAVTVDRPFIFLIRDLQTGAILFVGRVMNPV